MKAVHVIGQPDGTFTIVPLPLPARHRKGTADPGKYQKMAQGEAPTKYFDIQPADNLRTIALSDGRFTGVASQAGALLTFVLGGELTLIAGAQTDRLLPGDILLTDGNSAAAITLDVRNHGRLLQIGVPSDWPGAGAEVQPSGTINPRRKPFSKLKRVYTGDDDKAYFAPFDEMFVDVPNRWSAPRPVQGFHMLCWEDGEMDWHPCVVNQMGIIMSGENEVEVGGAGGSKEVFHAGDICLAEDRTGQGHIGRARGVTFVTGVVIETQHLWTWSK